MNDLIINVEKSTRMVLMTKTTVGNDMENLQEKIIFKFTDTFVDGQARLEYKIGSTKNYIELTKENNTYILPIQNVLTKEGKIEMQLVITEGESEENISVFKSNVFYLYCNRSLNAVNESPEGYDLWIEQANAKLNAMDEALTEVDNIDIDVSKSGTVATVTITKKNGTQDSVNINDGENGRDGFDGKDAKINGVNSLTIEAGENITLDQVGSTLTINSTGGGGGGTSNYNNLTNKPSINNVTLSGNKTLSDLGIQPAGNYALESDVPTKTSDLTNDSGFITGYTETDPTVPSHVKGITQANITSWNNKQNTISDLSTIRSGASAGATAVQPSDLATVATSGSYNDLSNKPSEVTESTVSGWGFTKNTGTYSKPSGGIPKSDLESSVQTSLGKADTAIQAHQDISGKLDVAKFYNDYYFSMPKTIYAKLNTEMKMYFNNITTANYLLKWGQYTNSTTIRDNDDYISVLPTAKATKNITYQVYDRFLNSIESGTTSFVINDTEPSSQTMLIIGDSFVSFNYIGPDLRDLFTNDGNTLTLIGTQGSGLNKHEGYAGWKYTDFTTNSKASSNPFWDGSKFNFTYYMNQNGYSNLDSVYIQLGTNDASAGSANQNMTDVINAAQTMINSILEYNSNIKIYLGLTVMPTLKTSKFAEKYNGIGLNWIMRANMQKLNKALIDTFSNNSSIKIVANNLILDSTTDISDNVHPTRTGFTKIANQVYYTMMS